MRKRWIYVDGEAFEVGDDFEQVRNVPVVGDLHYLNLAPPVPGADISTRTKHRRYMKENNLTTVDDFQNQWKSDATRREVGADPSRKWDIARAIDQNTRRK